MGASPKRGWNAAYIESLKPRASSVDYFDARTMGLSLRVFPTGAKVFRWRARHRHLTRTITIGPWAMVRTPAHVTLAEARDWLERLKEAHKAGVVELGRVEAQLAAALAPVMGGAPAKGESVRAVAEKFLAMLATKRKRPEEPRVALERDVLVIVGDVPIRDVKKADYIALIERIVARGAEVYAGKVLRLLKQFLDYAENTLEGFENPVARLKPEHLGVKKRKVIRDRWLSEKEIPTLWHALEPTTPRDELEHSMPQEKTALALRLLLLTAVRSSELRLARWADVSLKARTWTIPVANQKLSLSQSVEAKPFVIPLAPTALGLFEQLKVIGEAEAERRDSKPSEWVLSSGGSGGHYTDKAMGKAMRRLWRSHADLKPLPEASPHDLRRTARTWLGKLGVAPHICERCLNHSVDAIVKVYDQHDYLDERRAALEKWDAFVEKCVAPESSNVAFLPTR